MGIFLNDDGTLREFAGIFSNDNGNLRDFQSAFINDNGTLREVFRKLLLSAGSGGSIDASDGLAPYDSTVGIRFNVDGTVELGSSIDGAAISWIPAGQWITPLSAASGNFSVRYENLVSAGGHDFTSGLPINTAGALGSVRTWTWNRTTALGLPNNDFSADFRVMDDVGSTPDGIASYTFSIDNTG